MKKHLSILTLYARSTALPFLAILAAMAVAALTAFSKHLNTNLRTVTQGDNMDSIEQLIDYSDLVLIFGLAFLLVTVILCLPGCRFGSRTDYTIGRLSLDESTLFWWQTGYNAACYLILGAAMLAVLLGCTAIYTAKVPDGVITHQSVFLACYRSPLMHALLPLDNWPLWLRNAMMLCGISLAAARVPVCRRRGKLPVAVFVMALVFLAFPRDFAEMAFDVIIFWPCVFVIAYAIYVTIRGEEEDHA